MILLRQLRAPRRKGQNVWCGSWQPGLAQLLGCFGTCEKIIEMWGLLCLIAAYSCSQSCNHTCRKAPRRTSELQRPGTQHCWCSELSDRQEHAATMWSGLCRSVRFEKNSIAEKPYAHDCRANKASRKRSHNNMRRQLFPRSSSF